MKITKDRPLTNAFIEQLKVKMKDLRIRQTELASLLGTKKQCVYCWFKLKKAPCSETILKIQELLKTSFQMFL